MSDHDPQGGGFEITPEEDRFLRAFFRRHAGRYLLLVGVLAVAAVGVALRLGDDGSDAESARAELASLREQNQQLRRDLDALGERVASQDAQAQQMANLETRVAGALRRLERVESRVEEGPGPEAADASASWDVSSILERLYNLELRQAQTEQRRGSVPPVPSAPRP